MPVEEMIWSKAFLMERERFDGADVLHLIRARQKEINWPRLLSRFGEHWRVLLSHLVLFPYVYPNEPAPQAVIDELLDRAKHEPKADEGIRLCRGPLLSRAQYLVDVERWNYVDAREVPLGTMTPEEIDIWTKAIEQQEVVPGFSRPQNLTRAASCTVLGSPTAVTSVRTSATGLAGYAPEPKFVLRVMALRRLVRLNASMPPSSCDAPARPETIG